MARKRGRPSSYTDEIAQQICQRIADGESLRQICRSEGMPSASTVRGWVTQDYEGFSERYTRACEARCEFWAEEMLEIADDGTNDWMQRERADGSTQPVVDNEAIQRSRVRIDTRKWLMARLLPAKFGDKVDVNMNASHEHRYITDAPMDASAWEQEYARPEGSKATH